MTHETPLASRRRKRRQSLGWRPDFDFRTLRLSFRALLGLTGRRETLDTIHNVSLPALDFSSHTRASKSDLNLLLCGFPTPDRTHRTRYRQLQPYSLRLRRPLPHALLIIVRRRRRRSLRIYFFFTQFSNFCCNSSVLFFIFFNLNSSHTFYLKFCRSFYQFNSFIYWHNYYFFSRSISVY